MKELPPSPTKETLKKVMVRAKLVGKKYGGGNIKPNPMELDRLELRKVEHEARQIIATGDRSVCAKLAQDVLDIAISIDNIWREIFPVFEMVDEELKKNCCTLVSTESGYQLVSAEGQVLSQGKTLREFLIDHVTRWGDRQTHVYDPDSE